MTKETIEVKNLTDLRAWLEENSGREGGVWLVRPKVGSTGGGYFSYSDLVDELLCHGWIDSLPRKLDEERSMSWISPRNPKSAWSKVNKEKVGRLAAEGRLRPRALTAIEEAKRSGTWDKLTDIENDVLPEDLVAEFPKYEKAQVQFEAFPKSARKAILEWIVQAKTPETRQKRVAQTAEQASRNLRANQWKAPQKPT